MLNQRYDSVESNETLQNKKNKINKGAFKNSLTYTEKRQL